ncbi:MAG: hypothetical protein Q9218_007773 [Villophora microphyllina]
MMHIITADDYGPLVNIMTWFLLVATILTVFIRTAMKWAVARKTNWDDAVIIIATIFCIAESIAISLEVQNGLGQHTSRLTTLQRNSLLKCHYAAALLYIPSICLSKLAVALLLRTLTPVALHRRLASAIAIFTVVWAATAEMVMLFQCKPPRTWDLLNNHCIDSLLLDIALVILPWIIVRRVQISTHRKTVIACCFGTRLILVAAVGAQLAYFNSATRLHEFDLWSSVVCVQFVQSLSIITACVPYLKPFFDSLESGMIRSDDVRRRGLGPEYFYSAPLSRLSPGSEHIGDTWLGAKATQEIIELNTRRHELEMNTHRHSLPGSSGTTDGANDGRTTQGNGTLSRLSAIRRFSRPPPHKPSGASTLSHAGHDGDSDSQTSRSQLLRKISRPNKAKIPPPRA